MASAQIEEWKTRAKAFEVKDRKELDAAFKELDRHLTLRSCIVGYSQTEADLAVYQAIRGNHVANSFLKQGLLVNGKLQRRLVMNLKLIWPVSRWAKFIEDTNPELSVTLPQRPAKSGEVNGEKKKDEGANLDLAFEDTSQGVICRFPPEPSGYLHIGHAKVRNTVVQNLVRKVY